MAAGSPTAPAKRVTPEMLAALRVLVDGKSIRGNVHASTYWALRRRGLIEDSDTITAAGRAALAPKPDLGLVGEHALLLLRAVRAGVATINPGAQSVTVRDRDGMFCGAIMLEGGTPRILSDKCVKSLQVALGSGRQSMTTVEGGA